MTRTFRFYLTRLHTTFVKLPKWARKSIAPSRRVDPSLIKDVRSVAKSICSVQNCPQSSSGDSQHCYYHAKKQAGLIGDSSEYTVLTAEQWKEIRKREVLMDPAALVRVADAQQAQAMGY